jgi:hypothetical protein
MPTYVVRMYALIDATDEEEAELVAHQLAQAASKGSGWNVEIEEVAEDPE